MQHQYNNIFRASLLVMLSAILYGLLGFLGTCILRENISISTMLFWRFSIAGLWMFLFIFKNSSSQKILECIDKRTLLIMFLLGAIGYAGSCELYFIASQYTGTGLAMVIFFSYPIVIVLSSLTTHKKHLNKGILLPLIAMMIGLILLRDASTPQYDVIGILFGLGSAILYAFYIIGSKKHIVSITVDSSVSTIMVCFGCAFIFLILSISSHSFVIPTTFKTWMYLLALGIVATAIPIQLMLKGLKYISSVRASIISVIEPLMTVFVGVLLLDESISHLQWFGVLVILGSALFVQFQKEL